MRVLAGVDLNTEHHQWLCEQSVEFAARLQAPLDLCFVTRERNDSQLAQYEGRLVALAEKLVPKALRGHIRVLVGDPVEMLSAESEAYDVVLVGPREPSAIERVLHGTIQERIMRRARCSLVVLRGEVKADRPPRLLVGIDINSEGSLAMLGAAAAWAVALGGKVDGLYVDSDVLPPIHDRRTRALASREVEAARKPVFQRVSQMMGSIPAEVRGIGLVEGGNPESVLVQRSRDYDFVVIGTRDRRGVARYLLGSVPSFVLRRAGCSVLTSPTAMSD